VEFLYVAMMQVLLRALHQSLSMSLYCQEMKEEVETCVAPHHLHYPSLDLLISCVLKVLGWRGSKEGTTIMLQIGFPVQDPDLALLAVVLHVIVGPVPEGHLFLGLVYHFH
jgi:hypothetical protein